MSDKQNQIFDEIHEECGVFGMYDLDGGEVASTIYYGLFALQHRGQESCGIAVSDTEGPKGKVAVHKDMGLCNEVFTPDTLGAFTVILALDMCVILPQEAVQERMPSHWY